MGKKVGYWQLFLFFWTDGPGRVVFLLFMLSLTILSPLSDQAVYITWVWPVIIWAQSSNLNPAWRHTREKLQNQ